MVREYYGDKIIFSFTGLSAGKRTIQIKNFMLKLHEVTDEFKEKKLPSEWLEAFGYLKTFLKKKRKSKRKKVIFIDELPWAASHKSDFLPAFENFWNDYWTTRNDLVVLVCGSAAAYMVKKIINNRQGLHEGLTQTIKLKPFTLFETQAIFKYKHNPIEQYDLLKIYMTLGGVAEYLEHVNGVVNLCEMKYYNNEFSLDAFYLKKLINKEDQFRITTKTKKGIKTAMITTWGVKSNQYSNAIVRKSLTMECLFERT